MCKAAVFSVDVFYSFINTVLTNIFRRKLVVVSRSASKRYCVVHMINILLSPLSEVANKSVQVMSFRHFDGAILVVICFYKDLKLTYS